MGSKETVYWERRFRQYRSPLAGGPPRSMPLFDGYVYYLIGTSQRLMSEDTFAAVPNTHSRITVNTYCRYIDENV